MSETTPPPEDEAVAFPKVFNVTSGAFTSRGVSAPPLAGMEASVWE